MSTVHTPPGVRTSRSEPIPPMPYVLRVKSAEAKNSADPAKVGFRSMGVTCEIIAPDMVPHPLDASKQVRAAGRTANFYIPLYAGMKNYENAFSYLEKLELLEPDGSFDEAKVLAAFNAGNVFFQALIFSEDDYFGSMQAGKFVPYTDPATGKPLLKGSKISLINPEQIQHRVQAPPGFEAPAY